MNEFRKFNDIFRKDVTYDNIKSHEKPRLHHLSENTYLEKPQSFHLLMLDCALIPQSSFKKKFYETFGDKTSETRENNKTNTCIFITLFLRSVAVLPNHYTPFCNI